MAVILGLVAPVAHTQELTPDQKAAILLASARKAYNEGQYDFATQRFREFLQAYGGHKDANAARYGLGLTLLEMPLKDFKAAVDTLTPVSGVADFPDRPLVLYYLGLAYRGLGNLSLAEAVAKPNEAAQHTNTASGHFTNAGTQFAAALVAFQARVKVAPDANMPLPEDVEWAARSRCDQAEMFLRTNKVKEAAALVEPFLKDATLVRSRYRDLGRYYFGYAAYMQQDYLNAGQTLAQLAPFQDPVFGIHARYLLGRIHHLAEERAEALALYQSLLADFDQDRKAAQQSLQNPSVQNNPSEKARLEAYLKLPPPDYIARADFYLGVLLFEQEKAPEALDRFTKFAAGHPTSPLLQEAVLRRGYCQVQLKQFQEAVTTLTPLQDHAQLGDKARWWMGRAHVGLANPADMNIFNQNINAAINHLKTASDRAGQMTADIDSKLRRTDILLELADAQQAAKQFNEAAGTYQQIINEKVAPERTEVAAQRQCTALHLAAKYPESDNACRQFVQTYPTSSLLGAVLFRYAENAYAVAQAGALNPSLPMKEMQLPVLFGEAIKRYQELLTKFPDFEYSNLARFGWANSLYRLGKYAEAEPILVLISEPDRSGDLATVSYVQADCLIRTAPEKADDALAAGQLLQNMGQAVKLLESYFAANPKTPYSPEALLKIGHCQQRIAATMAEPSERNNAINAAKQAYERVFQQFANDPAAVSVAYFERAKCFAAANDLGNAINELNRFQNDPQAQSKVAPLALLQLATILRSQNKPADAANILLACRQKHEAAVQADPTRAAWVPLLQYHHALALKESAKLPEAQTQFDATAKQFATRAEGHEAAWRGGQCRKDQTTAKWDAALVVLKKPDAKPEEITAANTAVADAIKGLRETAAWFEAQAAPIGQQAKGSEGHLRMFYEAAWCHRKLAEVEIEAARTKLRDEALLKLKEAAAKNTPAGQPVPQVNAPVIPLAQVPLQPAEQLARQRYTDLIANGGEAQLVQVAQLELAEVHAARDEHDKAIPLLNTALDRELPAELEHKLRLRLGSCLLAKNTPQTNTLSEAADQFDIVATNGTGALAAEAQYRTAEVLLAKQDHANAIKKLVAFRDLPPLQNVPALSDRAVLRLGHAYAMAAQWDASRQAMEIVLNKFPQSPWRDEARYGQAWSLQNQGQFDPAINTYRQVTAATEGEVAAKAQLQIGLCFLAKKQFPEAANALLVVPFTYDYPELSGLALCEAARAFIEMKQPQQASQLLKRVMKDHPTSKWAETAKQRLAEIK